MKRFHSPLSRLSRLKSQAERLAALDVSRARTEATTAKTTRLAAEASADRHSLELTKRLEAPSSPWALVQAGHALSEQQESVRTAQKVETARVNELENALSSYNVMRQQREIVERLLDRQRDAHRRACLTAAVIDLLDNVLRVPVESHTPMPKDATHA